MSTLTIYKHTADNPISFSGDSLRSGGVSGKGKSDGKNEFADALAILSKASGTSALDNEDREGNVALLNQYSDIAENGNVEISEETLAEAKAGSKLQNIREKFAVLEEDPASKDWSVLEDQTSSDDFSILDKIGDGLLYAAKFAASAYLGKFF